MVVEETGERTFGRITVETGSEADHRGIRVVGAELLRHVADNDI
jgi:hypothetical protein